MRARLKKTRQAKSDDRFEHSSKLQRWETWRWPLPPHSACTSKGSIARDKEKLVALELHESAARQSNQQQGAAEEAQSSRKWMRNALAP